MLSVYDIAVMIKLLGKHGKNIVKDRSLSLSSQRQIEEKLKSLTIVIMY